MRSHKRRLNRKGLRIASALLLFIILTVIGCGGGDDAAGPVISSRDLLDRGWDKFEDADWSGALEDFQAVIGNDPNLSDAWNGAGWSAGRIAGRVGEAADYFRNCLERDTARYDALGGWTFVLFQQDEWQSTIDKADMLLHRRPGWRFLHEQTIDHKDVRLMMGAAHYNLGDFEAAYRIIVELNPSFETDINSPIGRRELLEEIERLRRLYG